MRIQVMNYLLVRKYHSKGNTWLFCSDFRKRGKFSSISTNTTGSQDHENHSTSKERSYDPYTSQIAPPPAKKTTLQQYRSRNKVHRPSVQRLGTYPSRAIGGTSDYHYPSHTASDPPRIAKRRNFFEELNRLKNARQTTSPK